MNINDLIQKRRQFYRLGKTRDIAFRLDALERLKQAIITHEKAICLALEKDLGKSAFESYLTEIGVVISEITHIIKKLRKWTKPKRKSAPLVMFPSKSYIYYEPFGSVLIMSPWNYPFQLAIMPLAAAIAAGNTCIVKPGSYSRSTAEVIKKVLEDCFPDEYVATVLGGREENQALLEEKFDFIFFTGSTEVGKLVMAKASQNLTPVCLELGGKSPAIVLQDADLKLAAKRIIFGKIINAGQTCIAPDYVLVQKALKAQLLEAMIKAIKEFLGDQPEANPDYPKIINAKHFNRLMSLLDDSEIAYGGTAQNQKIAPTLLVDVGFNDLIMQEEIFGPILPIIEYDILEDALLYVESRPKPLSTYLFSNNKKSIEMILNRLSSGGVTINDTLMHYMSRSLGFGGVGESGMGRYHGESGFQVFSNPKAVVRRYKWFDINLRYHPYTKRKQTLIKKILK